MDGGWEGPQIVKSVLKVLFQAGIETIPIRKLFASMSRKTTQRLSDNQEVLNLDYFIFPGIILAVGLLLAFVAFLFEIWTFYKKKNETYHLKHKVI